MNDWEALRPIWEGAADRLRARAKAVAGRLVVLEVDPVDYWAAIAEGLPEAEWDNEHQMLLAGVHVVVTP